MSSEPRVRLDTVTGGDTSISLATSVSVPSSSSNATVKSTDAELVRDPESVVMVVANPDGSNTITVLVAVTEFPASSVHACVKVYTPTWLTSTSSTVTVTAGLRSMASEHVAAGCIYRSPSSSLMLPGGVITGSVRSNVKDAISDAKFPLPTLSFALLAGVCTVTSPSPAGVTVNVKEDAVPVGRAGLAVPPVTKMSPANVTSSLNVTVNTALVEFVGDCSLAVSDVTVGGVMSADVSTATDEKSASGLVETSCTKPEVREYESRGESEVTMVLESVSVTVMPDTEMEETVGEEATPDSEKSPGVAELSETSSEIVRAITVPEVALCL